ncbi:MAG: DUF4358 domain-containing protein [Lachnospiraceae bacterium]|nr:DUF4358 domain-containing protein [Lachnospiraceae bacterium]
MRKFSIVLVATVAALSFTACAKEEVKKTAVNINVNEQAEEASEEKEVNVKELADKLLNDITYQDQLGELDMDTASTFYTFDGVEVEEAYFFESSGATAEEIVVIKCKDSDSAAKAKEMFKVRVSDQIDSYTDYVPEEVTKLNDAVIITSNNIAVLSVSNDSSKAKSIIEEAIAK